MKVVGNTSGRTHPQGRREKSKQTNLVWNATFSILKEVPVLPAPHLQRRECPAILRVPASLAARHCMGAAGDVARISTRDWNASEDVKRGFLVFPSKKNRQNLSLFC